MAMKKGDPGTSMALRNQSKEEVYPRVLLKRLSESITHPFQCTGCQKRFHKVYEATEHYFNSHQIFCDSFGKPFIKDLHVKNSNENKANKNSKMNSNSRNNTKTNINSKKNSKNNHKKNSINEDGNDEIIEDNIEFKTEYADDHDSLKVSSCKQSIIFVTVYFCKPTSIFSIFPFAC